MEDCEIARQVAEWNPQGKRGCRRPVNTWKDGIRDSIQRRNLKDLECSIESFGGKELCLWVQENCVITEKVL
jgi:hypothetical protein